MGLIWPELSLTWVDQNYGDKKIKIKKLHNNLTLKMHRLALGGLLPKLENATSASFCPIGKIIFRH